MTKKLGILLILLLIIVHLAIVNDYGFTWDFHFHFFGGGKLLGYEWQQLEPRNLPYVEPDPRPAANLPYGPLMSIPPVFSYVLFYKTLGVLPQDAAYNLPIILWGVAGVAILYLFMKEAFSSHIALLAAVFLALLPRFFGDLHNNMKDIPSATVFALNIWLLWRLTKHRRVSDLILAALAFAVAFNVKINSIFIPVIFVIWLLLQRIRTKLFGDWKLEIGYFVAAPILALLVWWFFWPDPFGQLAHAYSTFGIGTNNIEVLLNGAWYCSGSNVPWYYPLWYLAITTPIPILLFFIIGVFSALRTNQLTKLLLLLWFFVPLTRYLVPSIGVIDGIRHFEEVLFPMTALAALGAMDIIHLFKNKVTMHLIAALGVGILGLLMWNIISYHPYQIAYFNELVGGAKGAFGRYDLDYWGASQKAAVAWVNTHAPQGAKVHIVMSADVAGRYLRDDLLVNLNKYSYDASDFVILLNRQSFFYRFFWIYEYLLQHKPTETISVAGAPLVWIFDNRTDNKTPRQTPWWQGEDPCIIPYWKR
jgi:4-amino-4-deoxy-L-arabinose transferase-like glycosyltransferase